MNILNFITLDKLISFLRGRTSSAGLEISDTTLRLAYFDGSLWQLVSQRLPAGLMAGGIIQDKERLLEALKVFRKEIGSRFKNWKRPSKRVNVVVSLSSLNIYVQVFVLPQIEGETLNEAVKLNLQMLAPADLSKMYSGWQVVGSNGATHKEILAAFVGRQIVDDISMLLYEAGFSTAAVEFKALSIARLARELGVGFDPKTSSVILSIDDNGIAFLVVRKGQLYFSYFTPWSDFQNDKREINKAEFEAVILRNFNQVLNFSLQHFKDPVKEVFISASALSKAVEEVIRKNSSVTVKELVLQTDKPITSDWFAALGCGLRGLIPRRMDSEMTLISEKMQEVYHNEQTLNFLHFWRILVPTSLLILLLIFLGANIFLGRVAETLIEKPLPPIDVQAKEEFLRLSEQASQFNRSVRLIKSLKDIIKPQTPLLLTVKSIADNNHIKLRQFSFKAIDKPVVINGKADSLEDILNFKSALAKNPRFYNVDLPIQNVDSNFVFYLSFSVKPSNAE